MQSSDLMEFDVEMPIAAFPPSDSIYFPTLIFTKIIINSKSIK
jgi:hypothetical protein